MTNRQDGKADKPRLLEQARAVLRLHHYSLHTDVATTMIYTHVLQHGGQGVPSPLDDLLG